MTDVMDQLEGIQRIISDRSCPTCHVAKGGLCRADNGALRSILNTHRERLALDTEELRLLGITINDQGRVIELAPRRS